MFSSLGKKVFSIFKRNLFLIGTLLNDNCYVMILAQYIDPYARFILCIFADFSSFVVKYNMRRPTVTNSSMFQDASVKASHSRMEPVAPCSHNVMSMPDQVGPNHPATSKVNSFGPCSLLFAWSLLMSHVFNLLVWWSGEFVPILWWTDQGGLFIGKCFEDFLGQTKGSARKLHRWLTFRAV